MSAIFSVFGIDWRLLLIDAVNFGLVLVALWYFLYGPLTRMIEERRQKIAQGVIDADLARDRLAEVENSRAQMLAAAGKEADEVLSRARKTAGEKGREIVSQSEAAAARIVKDAELQAKESQEKAMAESRQEVAKLIVLGIERTIAQK